VIEARYRDLDALHREDRPVSPDLLEGEARHGEGQVDLQPGGSVAAHGGSPGDDALGKPQIQGLAEGFVLAGQLDAAALAGAPSGEDACRVGGQIEIPILGCEQGLPWQGVVVGARDPDDDEADASFEKSCDDLGEGLQDLPAAERLAVMLLVVPHAAFDPGLVRATPVLRVCGHPPDQVEIVVVAAGEELRHRRL
jgi:hypothetical protein